MVIRSWYTSFPILHLPPKLNDSAEDTDGKVGDFFVGIEMGLVHAGVGGDEGNSFGLFLDTLHGGLIAIHEDDGDVSAVYVIYCKNSL